MMLPPLPNDTPPRRSGGALGGAAGGRLRRLWPPDAGTPGRSGMSSGGGVPAVPRVLPVPSAMAKREKLEKIWQREAAKDDIIGKLQDRLSSGDQPRIGTANISREVDRFMGDKATVTEANLARLERRLQRQAKGLGSEADSEAVSISEYTTGSAALSLGSRASQQRRQPLSARQPGAMVTFREHPASICPTTSVSARGPPRGLGARGPAAAAAARQQGTPCTPSHGSRGIVGTAAPGAPGTPLGATPGLSPGALGKREGSTCELRIRKLRVRQRQDRTTQPVNG